jgi:predicted MPP superfamily phosphohydrolase
MLSRRRLLDGLAASALCAAGGAGWGVFLEPRWVQRSRHEVRLPGLPRSADGLRMVQVSDVHASPVTPLAWIEEALAPFVADPPDLFVITGDLVTEHPEFADGVARALARVPARRGSFAILGNHDWWHCGPALSRALERHGVRHLRNDSVQVEGLRLVGVDDHWTGQCDMERAFAGVGRDEATVLLMHSPDLVVPAAEAGVGLALAGHTHGGQVRVPGYGALIVPSEYGYQQGFYGLGGTRLYVNRGLGTLDLRVRTFCRPEIAEFVLRA